MSLLLPRPPGCGSVPPPESRRLFIDTPHPGIQVVRVSGVLGPGSAARFLRVLDAQLMLVRSGHRSLNAIIIDISGLEALDRGGPQALAHGRYTCAQLGVEFVLAGSETLYSAPISAARGLRDMRIFPTVDVALQVLLDSAHSKPGDLLPVPDDPEIQLSCHPR